MPNMPLFKEHVAVGQDDDCSRNNYDNCFYAFSILSHGNFFLHKIYEQMKEEDVYKRGVGYGIPGVKADGQNVVEVMELVSEAIERARRGEGPTLVECKTYRYHGHTENHDHVDGRDQEEYDYWFSRDPLKICE